MKKLNWNPVIYTLAMSALTVFMWATHREAVVMGIIVGALFAINYRQQGKI